VAGRQCTDFQCFAARSLDKGVEHLGACPDSSWVGLLDEG
jgi:uncharacterized protein YcgI (DUF1989 family)